MNRQVHGKMLMSILYHAETTVLSSDTPLLLHIDSGSLGLHVPRVHYIGSYSDTGLMLGHQLCSTGSGVCL